MIHDLNPLSAGVTDKPLPPFSGDCKVVPLWSLLLHIQVLRNLGQFESAHRLEETTRKLKNRKLA
jgi:hypothetical protein